MEINLLHPSFEIENLFEGIVAGVDEVGYGSWAGPVMAAAVVLPRDCPLSLLDLLDDSKKLSLLQREKIYTLLLDTPEVCVGIGESSVEEIDQMNIRQATLLAMTRALETLHLPLNAVIIDGTARPQCLYPCYAYVKGDQRSYSIAAASIIAKVTRDRLMQQLSLDNPHFGWEKNVGYGTKTHSEVLLKHGPTLWHRKSYRPIAALLEPTV
ncbi:MAG TPA: ribonuclease HII [Holosporales bacterium]|nr:ribonuclease HII [Holosporales bacterium]